MENIEIKVKTKRSGKRLLATLLVLCLMLSLMPTIALADTPTRTSVLTITGSTTETDSIDAEGWAWYPSGTTYGGVVLPANTLVLDGMDMNLPYVYNTSTNYYAIDLSAFSSGTVNVYLAPGSTNTIDIQDGCKFNTMAAINCPNAALSITGSGSLSFAYGSLPSLEQNATVYGINAKGSLNVTDATFDFTPSAAAGNNNRLYVYGINVSSSGYPDYAGTATITDATVDLHMPGTVGFQYGINANKVVIDSSIINYTNANNASGVVNQHGILAGDSANGEKYGVYISGSETEINIAAPKYPPTGSNNYSAITYLTSLSGGEVNCYAPVKLSGNAVISGGRMTVQSELTNDKNSYSAAIVVGSSLTLNNTIYKVGSLYDGSNAYAMTAPYATVGNAKYGYLGEPEEAAFTVQLKPSATNENLHRTNTAIDAGDQITYDIVLTQTSAGKGATVEGGGQVQTMDFTLNYDNNLAYVEDSLTTVTNPLTGLTITRSDNSLRFLMSTPTAVTLTTGQAYTVGTITLTTPGADTVKNTGDSTGIGASGAYPIAAPTVSTGGLIALSGTQSGVCPTVVNNAVTVYDIAAHYPTFANFSMTQSINNAAATDLTSAQVVHYTLNQLEDGYGVGATVNSNSGYYVSAYSLNANTGNGVTTVAGRLDPAATGDITVTAAATPTVYAIAYDEAGGNTVADGSYTIASGTVTLAIPTRTGYTFTGWTKTDGPTAGTFAVNALVNAATAQTATVDGAYGAVTLTAGWTPNPQTNTLPDPVKQILPNDGEPNYTPTTPKTDETVGIVITPPTGYYVSGLSITDGASPANNVSYYSAADLSGTVSFPVQTSETPVTVYFKQPASAVSVTPAYTPIAYTITYVPNGGSSVDAGSYNVESTSYTLPAAPTRTGYTFAGWKVTSAGSQLGAATDNTAYFSLNRVITEAITLDKAYGAVELYATWTAQAQTNDDLPPEVKQTSPNDGGDPATPVPPVTGQTVTIEITAPAGYIRLSE